MGDRLQGRAAVVTGAGRGIGRAIAELLASEGAAVVVNDLGVNVDGSGASSSVADEVVEGIRARGGRAVANHDSVSDFAAAERIIDTAVREFGAIDILVNNAGILRDRMIFNMSEEEWDSVIAVHLKGTFNCTRHAAARMREQRRGRIISMSSTSGRLRQYGAGELRRRQGRDRGPHPGGRARPGQVRHYGQRRVPRGQHANDGNRVRHGACGTSEERGAEPWGATHVPARAHRAGERRAVGGLPRHATPPPT